MNKRVLFYTQIVAIYKPFLIKVTYTGYISVNFQGKLAHFVVFIAKKSTRFREE